MGKPMLRTATTGTFLILLLFIFAISAPGSTALAQSSPLIATPRPADITAILDQEKQAPPRLAKARADADADPPSTQNKDLLAQFYHRRGQARLFMGRLREAISDAEMAIQHAGNSDTERYEALLSNAYSSLGDHKRVIEINLKLAQRYGSTQKGRNFSINLRLIQSYIALRDIANAEIYDKKSQMLLNEAKGWRNFNAAGSYFGGYTQNGHGRVLEARGLYRDAELAYHNAHSLLRDAIVKSKSWPQPPAQGSIEFQADYMQASEGLMKARQGRLAEAEADIRGALLSRLQFAGKYNTSSAQFVRMLAGLLAQQGRFHEAEQLLRAAVDIYRGLGYPEGSRAHAQALRDLADRLYSQQQYREAAEIYALLDEATKDWEAKARVQLLGGPDRIFLSDSTGQTGAGIKPAPNPASTPGSTALEQSSPSTAPPRPSDVTAILDQEKQDPRRLAKLHADADAEPPSTQNKDLLAQFYFRRGQARFLMGRNREAASDAEMAIQHAGSSDTERYEALLSNAYSSLGDHKRVIEINLKLAQRYGTDKGVSFSINLRLIQSYLAIGDIASAETYDRKSQTLLNEAKGWRSFSTHGSFFGGYVQHGHGRVLEARGLYRDAELAYRNGHILLRDASIKTRSWPQPPQQGIVELNADFLQAAEGLIKARQGRLTEGEADIRRALLSRLQLVGKYHASSAQMVRMLARLHAEQGRFREAEQLLRIAVDIYRGLGYPEGSKARAQALRELADHLYSQRQYQEAAEIYALLDEASKDWDAQERVQLLSAPNRIFLNYNTGRTEAGIELAHELLAREKARVGEKHFDYAMAQAILAGGLARAGKDSDALQIYKAAVPILLGSSYESNDDPIEMTGYERRMARVILPYLSLLARTRDASNNNAAESFQLGELIRRQSVQRALVASSARAAARNPQLAELVRKEQDLQKQVAARLDAMNSILALPPNERDEKKAASLRSETEKLDAQRAATRHQIEQRFPSYADLIASKPATLEDVRAALGPGEAFLSFYVGVARTFVWAVPKEGPVAFASAGLGTADIDAKVQKLRASLESQAASIRDIPPFDLALAHELYAQLLKPVESGWKSAKNLIVVTNGALGYLPLGLLPTRPVELKADGGSLFSNYREVPWLARTHTVTLVPSAMALQTLRQSPPGSNKREPMIGFGDPYFNSEQAAEAERASIVVAAADAATVTRGPVLTRRNSPQTIDSPDIAALPRLPDTAQELRSIAVALKADPSKALYLGKKANEKTVKDTDLSRFRIVAFATHGLLPGDLDGLTQPALAMTAPAVAGVPGDGLLTMEEILALKLDADWVVLSACNTGAGAGLGAEAVSGLGRAFFYAGTRAILVTNWSVHSQSARELVTDVFRRQAANSKLSRAEALRQAMMALLDGKGFTDEKGATIFSYAHPLFWAPYTIVGDGGG